MCQSDARMAIADAPPPPYLGKNPDRTAPQGMLSISDLRTRILKPVSLDLDAGACVAVRGPSGSGKSTLLRAIADLDPNAGEVRLDGRSRDAMPAPDWRRRVIYVAAEAGWWADTAAEHFPAGADAAALAEAAGLQKDSVSRPLATLSTGERQRLALIRALARQPRVLLLDEPTAALDGDARDRMEALIAAFRRDGGAALWVTHDPDQAERVADRTLHLDRGEARA